MGKLTQAIKDYNSTKADEQNLSAKSRKNRRLFSNKLTTYFANKDFNYVNCREFLAELRENNIQTSTIKEYTKKLKAFIRFCYSEDYIDHDFSNKIKPPSIPKAINTFISESDALKAIERATIPVKFDNRYARESKKNVGLALKFILFSGLRHSELRQLRVKDFNFSEKLFTVHSKGGDIELANIPLNMFEPMKEWLHDKQSEERVFKVTEDAMRNTLHRGCHILKLPRQRVHDLRHIGSLARLRRREPLQFVSRWLRHKKISTTDENYSRYLVTDLVPTANNTPEIQKAINEETILDNLEQLIKDFGITKDPRFKFTRVNGKLSIEKKSG